MIDTSNISLLRAQTDIGLVEKAKAGDYAALNQLIANNRDLIDVTVAKYRKAPIPTPAIEGEVIKLLTVAVQKFSPSAGASFRTYLETTLRGTNRYVNSNKNIARIPEHRLLRIRHYETLKSVLKAQTNREPTIDELSDQLGWSLADVAAMDKSLRQKDLSEMDFVTGGAKEQLESRITETADFLYDNLLPDEQLVYDYCAGKHGKPKISTVAEIARKTGMSSDRVYKLQRSVSRKITRSL
jgi:DNA-directed RNA polymerase sigma subunit (sigma70/sigma32)